MIPQNDRLTTELLCSTCAERETEARQLHALGVESVPCIREAFGG